MIKESNIIHSAEILKSYIKDKIINTNSLDLLLCNAGKYINPQEESIDLMLEFLHGNMHIKLPERCYKKYDNVFFRALYQYFMI